MHSVNEYLNWNQKLTTWTFHKRVVFYTTATHRKLSIFNENQKKIQQKTRNQQINTMRITAIGTANTTKIVDKFECRTIQIRMSNNSKIAASNCQTWNVTWCRDLPETKQKKLQNDDWRELKRHSVASQCTLRDVIMQTRCHSVHIHKSSVVIDFNKLLLMMMLGCRSHTLVLFPSNFVFSAFY